MNDPIPTDTPAEGGSPAAPCSAIEKIREYICGNSLTEVNTSMMQRRLRLGYTAAHNALEALEKSGFLGPINENDRWMRPVLQNI